MKLFVLFFKNYKQPTETRGCILAIDDNFEETLIKTLMEV